MAREFGLVILRAMMIAAIAKLCAFMIVVAAAEEPDIGPPSCMFAHHLRLATVQTELDMTTAQIREAEALAIGTMARTGAVLESVSKMDGEEKTAETERRLQPVQERWAKELSTLLTAKQRRRLRQIQLQPSDLFACQYAEIADALGLSDIQTDAVRVILTRYRAELYSAKVLPREEYRKATTRSRDEALQQLRDVVTKDQQRRLKELLGESFDPYKEN